MVDVIIVIIVAVKSNLLSDQKTDNQMQGYDR